MSTREKYYTTPTGVDMYWDAFEPTPAVAAPAILVLHVGGYKSGANGPTSVCQDLADAGFFALAVEYRLAPPAAAMTVVPGGHESPGQDTVNDHGLYPKQTDDVAKAIQVARADPRCNGLVYCLGGSAGASHSAYMAATGIAGDTKPELIALLSIGVSNLADPNLLALAEVTGQTVPHEAVTNYVGITPDPWPTYSPTDLATLAAASPVTYITGDMPPTYVIMSSMDSVGIPTSCGIVGQSSDGPPETAVENGLVPKLLSVGMTESTSGIPELAKFKKLVLPVSVHRHAFECWLGPVNGVSGPRVRDSIITWFQGGPPSPTPPPPPPSETLRGVIIGLAPVGLIDPIILADPNVDAVGLAIPWNVFEPTEGTYDFAGYIVPRIQEIAAAGKKVQMVIETMGGSTTFGGRTPNWVFTEIGNTVNGNPRSVLDGVTTSGSPTVTAPSGNFSDADLHQPISGANIPASTFVGIVNSPTSIGLSSSNTVNTPVNATGNGNPVVLTLSSRPRAAFDTHDMVPGATFTYNDPSPNHPGDPETTIPVFWEPTFLQKKRQMLNRLGNELTFGSLLTTAEKAAVAVIRVNFANAQTEDWNIPSGIDPTDPSIDWSALWLNSPTAPVYANRGAGYTTQKMLDAAVKRADETFTTGQTFTDTRLTSSTAYFTFADVGKIVEGAGIPAGATIASWTSRSEVQLSVATTASASGVTFTIKNRDTGIVDIAMAAFPGKLIELAIGGNGPDLDADAAAAAGDTDVGDFLARTACNLINVKFSARFVTTKNSLTAVSPIAPPTGTFPSQLNWKLLYQISHQFGFYVAGQDAFKCFQDPAYRMNGGDATDKDHPGGILLTDEQILERAGERLFGYSPLWQEIFAADAIGLPNAIAFIHDLLTGGGPPPPPPPPPPGDSQPPFHAPIRTTLLSDLIAGVAGLLQVDLETNISPSIARTWFAAFNRHTRFAWEFWPWPELFITEERAFRAIWNSTDQYRRGEEVFYLETFSYYRALSTPDIDPPIGTRPTDDHVWEAISLTNFYIQLDQRCRQAIGQIMGVFQSNPYQLNDGFCCSSPPRPLSLPYTMSERGIELPPAGMSVFLHYKLRPSRFDSRAFEAGTAYAAGSIVYSELNGDCYRSLREVTGIAPETDTAGIYWTRVPMPYVISDYVMYATAADMSESQQQKAGFLMDAERVLVRETDKTVEQDPTQRVRYKLTRGQTCWPQLPCIGTDGSPGATVTTLTTQCVNAFGELVL